MRHRFLMAVVVAGLPLAAATPAVARSHKSTSHQKTLVVSTRVGRTRKLGSLSPHVTGALTLVSGSNPGNDTELYTGFPAGCTAPNGPGMSGNGQNFRSSDTTEFENGDHLALVLTCTADLSKTKSTTGTAISYNTTKPVVAIVNSCGLYSAGSQSVVVTGTGISVTFPDGLFVETCTSDVPPL